MSCFWKTQCATFKARKARWLLDRQSQALDQHLRAGCLSRLAQELGRWSFTGGSCCYCWRSTRWWDEPERDHEGVGGGPLLQWAPWIKARRYLGPDSIQGKRFSAQWIVQKRFAQQQGSVDLGQMMALANFGKNWASRHCFSQFSLIQFIDSVKSPRKPSNGPDLGIAGRLPAMPTVPL